MHFTQSLIIDEVPNGYDSVIKNGRFFLFGIKHVDISQSYTCQAHMRRNGQ